MPSSKHYLTKSKFLSGLQCRKKLWLSVNHPELVTRIKTGSHVSPAHPPKPKMATERKIKRKARIANARLNAVPHELVLLCLIQRNGIKALRKASEERGLGRASVQYKMLPLCIVPKVS